MTRLFTKLVALAWLIGAIVAMAHNPKPAPADVNPATSVQADGASDRLVSQSQVELRVTE
jgi:hypothetical protein